MPTYVSSLAEGFVNDSQKCRDRRGRDTKFAARRSARQAPLYRSSSRKRNPLIVSLAVRVPQDRSGSEAISELAEPVACCRSRVRRPIGSTGYRSRCRITLRSLGQPERHLLFD